MASFTDFIDLASERLGGAVVAANDEFFAPREALIKAAAPEWREGAYTERGKWMDGWETRRRRSPGYDWAIIRLGAPGIVRGVVIDTSFFTGNFPERASIDACAAEGTPSTEDLLSSATSWEPLLDETSLVGNTRNEIVIERSATRVTHLRLNIFPDGGVARLRVHGDVVPDERIFTAGREADLAAMENGGFVVECSDMHYGHRQNLILPGRSTHMGDGWETRRRRGVGHDWTIVRLARRGSINRVELDTDHFKGNAPGSIMIEACDLGDTASPVDVTAAAWSALVTQSAVQPHARHHFDVRERKTATHVRLNIYPDGGVARLRVFGRVAET
ncbi:MAG TPA: allantoicase [Gemmatimonadaceae bacterium]|nr:allantoicase [Gemmatimonadaceae bacterium]